MRVTEWSLVRPVGVLVFVAALVVLGAVSVPKLPREFLPQKDFPFIGVYVPYANGVPSQVEKEITRPIEEILATLGDVKESFSESEPEHAFIGVQFDFGRDVNVLRMEVKEKLDQVRPDLPDDVRNLFIFTFNTNDIPVMVGRISAHGRDLSSSYDLLDRHVIQRLERVPGVGRVQVDGVLPADISIYLHMDRILEHNVDVQKVFERVASANLDLTLGRVSSEGDRFTIRAVGEFGSIEEIEDLVINDVGLRLGDIASIVYDEPAPTYRRRLNGEPAVAFEIQRASGANIVELSKAVERTLDEIREDPALEGIDVVLFFDQGDQIQDGLEGLLTSGLLGSLLALSVLYLFLRRLVTTLVVSVAIPFSIIATCVVLYLMGRTLNVLTMMGLMLATGMLVDNAIVVLESIHRKQASGMDPVKAASLGTREVGRAVVAATATSICVFAPVVLTPANEIMVWLSEVGVTIIVALCFSLVISLTLVPLIMARVAPGRPGGGEVETLSGPLVALRRWYLRALDWTAVRHPVATLFITLGVCVGTFALAAAVGYAPEPDSDEGIRREELALFVNYEDNVNIYGVEKHVDRLEQYLLAARDSLGVQYVYTFYTDNTLVSRLYFEDGAQSDDRLREVRRSLRDGLPLIPGARIQVGREEGQTGGGAEAITVTLFGDDSDYLAELSTEVKRRLGTVDGLVDIESDLDRGKEEVRVSLRTEEAGRFGITPRTVAQIMNLTFRGTQIGEYKAEHREVPIGIVLEPTDRRNVENLKSMVVSRVDGQDIELGQVASFEVAHGPARIYREDRRTALPVYATYEGEAYDEALEEVEALMSSVDMPEGYAWSFGREIERSEEEVDAMLVNILLALCCVYFVMASLFESFLHPLVIMICIPFAIVGVIWLGMATGTPLNFMGLIGVVILIGVVVNNGIILIDHINEFRRRGRSREEAILSGGEERFRPILMTALTTILGLMPLALGKAAVGDGYYYPMARAVMGGLAASTLLTLLVLPTFYVLAERAVLAVRRVIWKAARRFETRGGAPVTARRPT